MSLSYNIYSLPSNAPPPQPPQRICDHKLLSLLHDRKIEEAWLAYSHSTHLPNFTCLNRLVFQLLYQNTLSSLTHAQSIVTRLRNERQLHRLNANCLGLLVVSTTKVNHTLYAASFLCFMLRSGYLPHVKAWIVIVGHLTSSLDRGHGPERKLNSKEATTRKKKKPS
ncbi:Pentatricopeptide repeat-containing protein, chloroplastic [Glycine soja]